MNWITKTFGRFFEKARPQPASEVQKVQNVLPESEQDRFGPRGPAGKPTQKVIVAMSPSMRRNRRGNYSHGDKIALRLDRNDWYRERIIEKEKIAHARRELAKHENTL